jgi:hypothetical protein
MVICVVFLVEDLLQHEPTQRQGIGQNKVGRMAEKISSPCLLDCLVLNLPSELHHGTLVTTMNFVVSPAMATQHQDVHNHSPMPVFNSSVCSPALTLSVTSLSTPLDGIHQCCECQCGHHATDQGQIESNHRFHETSMSAQDGNRWSLSKLCSCSDLGGLTR